MSFAAGPWSLPRMSSGASCVPVTDARTPSAYPSICACAVRVIVVSDTDCSRSGSPAARTAVSGPWGRTLPQLLSWLDDPTPPSPENTAWSTSISVDSGGTPIMSTRATAVAAPAGEVTDMELLVAVPAGTSNGSEKIELISVPVSSYHTTCSSVSAHPAAEYMSACHVYATARSEEHTSELQSL